MSYLFKSIKIDFEGYVSSKNVSLKEINNLSKINIFVGANNSGKSRFLRNLSKIENYKFKRNDLDMTLFKVTLEELNLELDAILKQHTGLVSFTIDKVSGTFNVESLFPLTKYYSEYFYNLPPGENKLSFLIDLFDKFKNPNFRENSTRGSQYNIRAFENQIHVFLEKNKDKIEIIKKYIFDNIKFSKYYIPILRSLYFIDDFKKEEFRSTETYKHIIQMNYQFDNGKDGVEIFTGQNLYKKVKKMLLGEKSERDRIDKYEQFLSSALYNNLPVSLIPREESKVLYVKIGEVERPIFELGDGVQSLIILTFPLFEISSGLFFIDEPELHLHPGMQRKFIEALRSRKNHQYFITTHSNHFVDLTLDYNDISIFTFNKEHGKDSDSIVTHVTSGDENILRLLGAQNSSVFLSNSTIWVEGITDRLYIRKFIELYQKNKKIKIQEDIDYSFVEYGGSNITHWSFLDSPKPSITVDRLCGRLMLIADQDGNKNIQRKKQLREKLGSRYKLLQCREIENILSLKTIESVIRKYPQDKNFIMKKFKTSHPHKFISLGRFINRELKPSRNYEDKTVKTGTIANKLAFCEKAIEDMQYSDMTSLAKRLVEKIYKFVIESKRINS